MDAKIFGRLPRREQDIYLSVNGANGYALVYLGCTKAPDELEKLKNKAAKLVFKYRAKFPGDAQTDATWCTGEDLQYSWLGRIPREKYNLKTIEEIKKEIGD